MARRGRSDAISGLAAPAQCLMQFALGQNYSTYCSLFFQAKPVHSFFVDLQYRKLGVTHDHRSLDVPRHGYESPFHNDERQKDGITGPASQIAGQLQERYHSIQSGTLSGRQLRLLNSYEKCGMSNCDGSARRSAQVNIFSSYYEVF